MFGDFSPLSQRMEIIFSDFYSIKAQDRYLNLRNIAEIVASELSDMEPYFDIIINDDILIDAIDSYYLDVIRYKEYHFDPSKDHFGDLSKDEDCEFSKKWAQSTHSVLLNNSKVATLTAKWILKHKPIYVKIKQSDIDPNLLRLSSFVNELFAFQAALYSLEIPYESIDHSEIVSFLYDFKYRNFEDRNFFTVFEMLERRRSTMSDQPKLSPDSSKQQTEIRPLKIFLASPSDVSNLRDETCKIVDEINETHRKQFKKDLLEVWRWELDKDPEAFESPEDYQKHVFQEFGEHCDIFIILFWKSFGKGTVAEYEHYKNTFKRINPKCKFWLCRYGKPVPPDEHNDSLKELNEWISQNEDYWAPIGGTRNKIQTPVSYKKEMRKLLNRAVGYAIHPN